ncbi:hypothetical protein NY08_552 [Rhodococcus sp. B7740]|uniref:hypothetical protein n=1 Tax=Rhodococcus sp. B7740 TaxID=1564114 RepID=UPI0005D92781|nr:hypothetical protein [Rhodococcus sp. B7740]AJW38584.1 hypothetical protein NY08_552 [Rhodococcus sp. B7740]
MRRRSIDLGLVSSAVIQVTVLVGAFFRGLDYAVGTETGAAILGDVERAAPLPVWGWALMLGSVAAVVGWLGCVRRAVALGYTVIGLALVGIGFGQLVSVLSKDEIDGYRTPIGVMAGGVVALALAGSAWMQSLAEKGVPDAADS